MRSSVSTRPARRRPRRVGVFVVAALMAAGCGSSGTGASTESTEVKIGFVVPYSGVVAKYGQDANHAWQLALEKYGNTVNGYKLEQVKFDEKCQPAAAVRAVRQALGADVVALLGPTCSGDVLATLQAAAQAKVPLITQAYAPDITARNSEYIWRMPASDEVLNANLAKFLKAEGFTKIGVAHDTTGFGQAEGQTIVAGLKAVGITPVANLSYTVGATDFSGEAQKMKSAGADAVCLMGYDPDTARFAFQLRQLGVQAQICSNQAISYATSLKTAPDAVEGAYFYAPFLADDDRFKPFVDAWRAKYNETVDTEGYMYYLSAVTIIEALKTIDGEVTGEKLNEAIGKLSVDVQGLTRLAFSDTGDPKCPTVLVGTVSKGKPKVVQDDSPSC
ncbi:MAG: ABC transporter substrate-binding protein [Propionibacteriales bacterium]|nr:ABC transporter substrate-binding protein [Propionibacteriales bacterium]